MKFTVNWAEERSTKACHDQITHKVCCSLNKTFNWWQYWGKINDNQKVEVIEFLDAVACCLKQKLKAFYLSEWTTFLQNWINFFFFAVMMKLKFLEKILN